MQLTSFHCEGVGSRDSIPDLPRFDKICGEEKKKIASEGTHRRTFPAVGPFVMRYHQTKTGWHKIARLFPQCMLNWKNTPQQR